jgi:hypothetical protein
MAGGGRSYEQNPETADPSSYSRSKLRDQKEKVGKDSKDLPASAEKISYGKRFARTEELYQARVMEKELEELARADGALDETPAGRKAQAGAQKKKGAKKPAPGMKKAEGLTSRHQVLEQVTRGAPIGSIPPLNEAPARGAVSDVIGDAERYLELLRSGIRDVGTAGARLARLPIELIMLAMARLRPQHG